MKAQMQAKETKKARLPRLPKLVVLPVVVVVLAGFVAAWLWLLPQGQRIDSSVYQAVYLTNGQAYFGKLKGTSGEYVTLESPYTVQEVQAENGKDAQGQTTLLKVRDQVYGPDDSIALRSENILFWQNLRSDSKVQQAIEAKQ